MISMVCNCKQCGKDFVYSRKNGSRKTMCATCKVWIYKKRRKQELVDYCGGECQRCGYNKSNAALQFHHLDSSTKLFRVGANYHRKWADLTAEADKCLLLCANCHAEEHERKNNGP